MFSETHRCDKNFIRLFKEQVETYPNAIAIANEGVYLTYAELNYKSDRVANYLRMKGVKQGIVVGLCASLSIDFIITLLGILKARGVYFPLDPEYPLERLNYMLADASPAIILVETQFVCLLKSEKIIEISEEMFNYMGADEIESSTWNSDDLAYIIYTSGSTGLPKGIMITYGSLPNIALSHHRYYPSNMKMLVSGGVCFDASLLVIFHALVNNSSLYLFNSKKNTEELHEFISRNSIEYMICIPSQYLKLLQSDVEFPMLRCVSLTGENLPSSLCHLHAKLAPNAFLYNEYGPTECAIGTTIAKVYDPQSQTIRKVTVGKALPNTKVCILDPYLNKVSEGTKGEICISGTGLAQGYLNKEFLTKEKFVWVRFPGEEPIRIYRTGDSGRFLPNGELEFLGRMDQRVLICNEWVDLGEVEYHISRCPDIKESALVVQQNPQGEKQLVAYITSNLQSAKKLLLTYLADFLPKYMMPTRIIQLDAFSFTPNGKIDRSILETFHE